MIGICRDCGEPIEYELEDVGIGVRVPHGFCTNKKCRTYGWATSNIEMIEDEGYEDDDSEYDDIYYFPEI